MALSDNILLDSVRNNAPDAWDTLLKRHEHHLRYILGALHVVSVAQRGGVNQANAALDQFIERTFRARFGVLAKQFGVVDHGGLT